MGVRLVVMQSTSFCNLDCKYCYLPDRSVKGNIEIDVLTNFFRVLFNSHLAEHCRIVWHAGEPLVSGIPFFESVFEIQQRYDDHRSTIEHWVQTNGTLINDEWCQFFKTNNIHVSVSLDGPKSMHDHFRKDRKGGGTFANVELAVRRLQQWKVKYNVLSVVTRNSLPHADEYFSYLLSLGVRRVGINIEELNVQAGHSSMVLGAPHDFEILRNEYIIFLRRLFQLWKSHQEQIEIREFAQLCRVVTAKVKCEEFCRTSEEHVGLEILNVKKNGDVSTFAPELVESRDGDKDFFRVGNVKELSSFDELHATEKFVAIETEVNAGIAKCRASCEYFDFCGGGHLSAKYFENGTLNSSETKYCQLHRKAMTDVVLDGIATA
jgi:uncharacterized protein